MKRTNLSHCDFHNTLLVLKSICIEIQSYICPATERISVYSRQDFTYKIYFQISPTAQKATQTFKPTDSFILSLTPRE